MLPTLEGVEPMTSWSPVGWRIQLSHWGWQDIQVDNMKTVYPPIKVCVWGWGGGGGGERGVAVKTKHFEWNAIANTELSIYAKMKLML